jgi:hypothetical protein
LHRGPVNNAVRQNVIEQVNSLHDLDPILHQNNTDGEILIVGAVNDIHTVKVEVYRTESKEGGKLDFKSRFEKHEGAFIAFDGVMYNKKDFSILMWGASVRKIGIKDFSKAQNIWEQINSKKLTEPELNALKKGFEAKF